MTAVLLNTVGGCQYKYKLCLCHIECQWFVPSVAVTSGQDVTVCIMCNSAYEVLMRGGGRHLTVRCQLSQDVT